MPIPNSLSLSPENTSPLDVEEEVKISRLTPWLPGQGQHGPESQLVGERRPEPRSPTFQPGAPSCSHTQSLSAWGLSVQLLRMPVLTEGQGRVSDERPGEQAAWCLSCSPLRQNQAGPWPDVLVTVLATAAEGHAESKGAGFLRLALSFQILAAFPSLKREIQVYPPTTPPMPW